MQKALGHHLFYPWIHFAVTNILPLLEKYDDSKQHSAWQMRHALEVCKNGTGQAGDWSGLSAETHGQGRVLMRFSAAFRSLSTHMMKAKWRVCGERGSAKIACTKIVHQKYLPRSSAKVSGISLQSVLLPFHELSTNSLGFYECPAPSTMLVEQVFARPFLCTTLPFASDMRLRNQGMVTATALYHRRVC